MEMMQIDDNPPVPSAAITSPSPPPRKKFKSYTTQFDDDTDLDETSSHMTTAKRTRRELEIYLQVKLTNYNCSNEGTNNSLLFWKEQEYALPNI
ncbi:unnamed protein product [Rotaria magnacalcarata]|uniref:Uncharacterized protein n=1 Tax=Rotaria magnacalcarata TaxID=392030 RepID=A0A819Y3R2_9BILA|nr:unnamed protein product [Rotaria magnacalcarata]CAF2210868.1 unnamed protein product [Rotaria magnacalcarata]CAF4149040.1 unnamed protein product [Rotaria magnacalcarata]CAF4303459.1 unnamed protein product [Rotaria magnacalcarata]